MANVEQDRARLLEIREQVRALNLEAEKLILANQKEGQVQPEGRGACTYWLTCGCQSYVSGGAPGVCNRSHCTHTASEHEF